MTIILLLIINILITVAIGVHILKTFRKVRSLNSEFYTDYTKDGVILRIYKPEFEVKALEGYTPMQILDMGRFSPYYNWVLIEKRHDKKNKKITTAKN